MVLREERERGRWSLELELKMRRGGIVARAPSLGASFFYF